LFQDRACFAVPAGDNFRRQGDRGHPHSYKYGQHAIGFIELRVRTAGTFIVFVWRRGDRGHPHSYKYGRHAIGFIELRARTAGTFIVFVWRQGDRGHPHSYGHS